MSRSFNSKSNGNWTTIKKGHVSLQYKSETYQGKEQGKYTGSIKLDDGSIIIISLDVEPSGSNRDKVYSYAGKGDSEGKYFCRIHTTHGRYNNSNSNGRR